MASTPAPGTPSAPHQNPAPLTPTGTWRHPKLDEITKRQNATTFNDRNIRIVLWNGISLFGTWAIGWVMRVVFSPIYNLTAPLSPYTYYPLWAIRLLLLFNVLQALAPLLRPKDDLLDIPLTPSQRALLGLDPKISSPKTPGAQYITPPRYPRSSTPASRTPGSQQSAYSTSPLSRQETPSRGRANGSPFSPSPSSMLQKAFGGSDKDLVRRNSYGSPVPLGAGANGSSSSLAKMPSTPSPSSGKGPSLGLNNRWLYERGRTSPASGKLYS
ncbi:MAG: hypothetical protein M4579_001593 [Chaenotheca gracillima]|nr:MAG: hypothetical protein M4579_001593 [Chaenotheca gracillima]